MTDTERIKTDLGGGRALYLDVPRREIERRIEFVAQFDPEAEVNRLRAMLGAGARENVSGSEGE